MPESPSHSCPLRPWLLGPLALGAGLLLACARGPVFAYERAPGVALEDLRALALDPRQDMVWSIEGQRIVPAPDYRAAVIRELEARGFRLVAPDQAQVWLEVLVGVPERSGGGEAKEGGGRGGHEKRGGGPGGGMGGSGRGQGGGPKPGGRAEPSYQALTGGEATVVVKLLARTDQRTLWSGSGSFPTPDRQAPPGFQDSPEGRVHQLLAPYPGDRP